MTEQPASIDPATAVSTDISYDFNPPPCLSYTADGLNLGDDVEAATKVYNAILADIGTYLGMLPYPRPVLVVTEKDAKSESSVNQA